MFFCLDHSECAYLYVLSCFLHVFIRFRDNIYEANFFAKLSIRLARCRPLIFFTFQFSATRKRLMGIGFHAHKERISSQKVCTSSHNWCFALNYLHMFICNPSSTFHGQYFTLILNNSPPLPRNLHHDNTGRFSNRKFYFTTFSVIRPSVRCCCRACEHSCSYSYPLCATSSAIDSYFQAKDWNFCRIYGLQERKEVQQRG